jgi:hypothetical protein
MRPDELLLESLSRDELKIIAEALSNVVCLHVHSQGRSATDHPYAASAA